MKPTHIYVFTAKDCSFCSALKSDLQKENIDFTEIEVLLNKNIWETVVKSTGEDVVPTVFIRKDKYGNGKIYIPGKDFQSNEEIIEIIKMNI